MRWTTRVCLAAVCVLVVLAGAALFPHSRAALGFAGAGVAALAAATALAVTTPCPPTRPGPSRVVGGAKARKPPAKMRPATDGAAAAGEDVAAGEDADEAAALAVDDDSEDDTPRGVARMLTPEELAEISDAIRAGPAMADLTAEAKTMVEYKDIEHRTPYYGTETAATRGLRRLVHNGQLKLFLTELQFLTNALKVYLDPCYVVYAGSAPSHKLGMLSSLFPGAKFVLIDPAEHLIRYERCASVQALGTLSQYAPDRVDSQVYFKVAAGNRFNLRGRRINLHGRGVVDRDGRAINAMPADLAAAVRATPAMMCIIEDNMTEDLAQALAPLGMDGIPLLFISDVRTHDREAPPSDIDILWNSAQHLNWLRLLAPREYMLKFHPPYPADAARVREGLAEYRRRAETHADLNRCAGVVDFIKDYEEGRFVFLAGDHTYIQAFAPLNSTEVRLIGRTLDLVAYDMVEFEERMRYYNVFHRPLGNHKGMEPYENRELGLDRCGDCAIASQIISGYLIKFFGAADAPAVATILRATLRSIGRTVFDEFNAHGRDDIHTIVAPEVGHNVETVVAHLFYNYLRRTLKHTPRWEGHTRLEDALRWAELRALAVELLAPFWKDGIPKTSARPMSYHTAKKAAVPVMKAAMMGFMFGTRVGEYYTHGMLTKFIGGVQATRVARQLAEFAAAPAAPPKATLGFELLADGFRTDAGGAVRIPPQLRELYTPRQYAIEVLFTEGVSIRPSLDHDVRGPSEPVAYNCRVDSAIAAAAADVRRRLAAAPTLVEVNMVRRGYYTWRAAAGHRPIAGVASYAQRCLLGEGAARGLDCAEEHGAAAIILIYLISIPEGAANLIDERVRAANPRSHVITISRWRPRVPTPDPEFALTSVCLQPTTPTGCGAEPCRERGCHAMFMHATPPARN